MQIEELSNQNEDLICKLKESMERELVLRYPTYYFSLLLAYLLLCCILIMIFFVYCKHALSNSPSLA